MAPDLLRRPRATRVPPAGCAHPPSQPGTPVSNKPFRPRGMFGARHVGGRWPGGDLLALYYQYVKPLPGEMIGKRTADHPASNDQYIRCGHRTTWMYVRCCCLHRAYYSIVPLEISPGLIAGAGGTFQTFAHVVEG